MCNSRGSESLLFGFSAKVKGVFAIINSHNLPRVIQRLSSFLLALLTLEIIGTYPSKLYRDKIGAPSLAILAILAFSAISWRRTSRLTFDRMDRAFDFFPRHLGFRSFMGRETTSRHDSGKSRNLGGGSVYPSSVGDLLVFLVSPCEFTFLRSPN